MSDSSQGYVELQELCRTDRFVQYELFFGPNFPGMHGNFGYILDVAGSTIVGVRPNPGLLHRGFEKLMERKSWLQNISLIPRICVPDPDPNEAAYCQAIEKIMDLPVPPRARYLRTIVLEMSRLASYLMGMGALGSMMGLYTAMYRMINDRDLLLDLFEWLTGARIYHIYMLPGGVRRDLPEGWVERLEAVLETLEGNLPEWDRLVFENPVVVRRLSGIGPVTAAEAVDYGLTGPNLRAAGVRADIRVDDPYAAYPELEVEIPTTAGGDALARAVQIRREYEATLGLLRRALRALPGGAFRTPIGNPLKFTVPPGDAYARVESSKGEFGYYVVSDGGLSPYRVSVRGPSLPAGLALCHKHLPGMLIDDVAIWMASLAVCPPDFDR
jgi:NADH-quinone oxidoreductase subunit D